MKKLYLDLKGRRISKLILMISNTLDILLELSCVYQWKGEYDLAVKYNLKSMDVAKKYKMQKLISDNLYHESLMLISRGIILKQKVL